MHENTMSKQQLKLTMPGLCHPQFPGIVGRRETRLAVFAFVLPGFRQAATPPASVQYTSLPPHHDEL